MSSQQQGVDPQAQKTLASIISLFNKAAIIIEDLTVLLEKVHSQPPNAAEEMKKKCMQLENTLKKVTQLADRLPEDSNLQVPVWMLEALEWGQTPLSRARDMVLFKTFSLCFHFVNKIESSNNFKFNIISSILWVCR